MSKKELAELYVETLIGIEAKEQLVSEALKQLHPDNYTISLTPDSIYTLLKALALDTLGENAMDWIEWWIYESSGDEETVIIDEVPVTVCSFDELWGKVINV